MLDNRPLLRNTVAASGAFMFVFSAAMAGSAFMISGGFASADNARAVSQPAEYGPIPVYVRDVTADYQAAPRERATYVEAAYTTEEAFEEPRLSSLMNDEQDLIDEPAYPISDDHTFAEGPSEAELRAEIEQIYSDASRLDVKQPSESAYPAPAVPVEPTAVAECCG